MARGIEIVIAFVISTLSLLTGIILYGYSPGITNSEGQLVMSETGITGIALVIVGLVCFRIGSIHINNQDPRLDYIGASPNPKKGTDS